jgi:tRNA(fMet)-specific endonuclease VapC
MILLDTDHLSVLQVPSSERRTRLVARMTAAIGEDFGTTIVCVEEQMRGWLAAIAKEKSVKRHVAPYRELGRLFEFFQAFTICQFDDRAADEFANLRSARIRIGTMDLKIASIALVNGALLLTGNRGDFAQVPGLRLENWMD